MKGGGSSVIPVYAGMRYDFEALLTKFKERASPRFYVFRELFVAEQFGKIFAGRLSPAELVEFSERLLQMAATYMHPYRQPCEPVYQNGVVVSECDEGMPRPVLERIFGVYVTYALYFLQPSNYVVQVRVTPVQMEECRKLLVDLIADKHLDTVGCMMKLVANHAFSVVAFNSAYDPMSHKRYELSQEDDDCAGDYVEPPFTDAKSLMSDPLLKQLEVLSHKTPHIQYMDNLRKMNSIVDNYMFAVPEPKITNVSSSGPTSQSRSHIKDRAYKEDTMFSRNRRYADPALVAGSMIQLNVDETAEKKKVSLIDEANEEPEPEKEAGEEEPEAESPTNTKGRGRGRAKGRGRGRGASGTARGAATGASTPNTRGKRKASAISAEAEETLKNLSAKEKTDDNKKSSAVHLIEGLQEVEPSTPRRTPRKKPARPVVKDVQFEAKLRATLTKSTKQQKNEKLMAELMNIPDDK